MTKKEIIKNAICAAIRDGYNQIIYTDDEDYAFSRDYPLNNMYDPKNVIGHVITGCKNGIFYAKFVSC